MTTEQSPPMADREAPSRPPATEHLRLVVQRARDVSIRADGKPRGTLSHGLVVYAGFGFGPSSADPKHSSLGEATLALAARKIFELRTFGLREPHSPLLTGATETATPPAKDSGRMHLSVRDVGGGLAIVSQFTLWADCRQGNRPGFQRALPPARAQHLYEHFISLCVNEAAREPQVKLITGLFGADMEVAYINDGPVTYVFDVASAKVITL